MWSFSVAFYIAVLLPFGSGTHTTTMRLMTVQAYLAPTQSTNYAAARNWRRIILIYWRHWLAMSQSLHWIFVVLHSRTFPKGSTLHPLTLLVCRRGLPKQLTVICYGRSTYPPPVDPGSSSHLSPTDQD